MLINVDPNNLTSVTRKSALQFKMVDEKPTVYLCHNQVCELPITSIEELNTRLSGKYVFRIKYD